MAYKCPRCDGDVSRGTSGAHGLAGAMFTAAFGTFRCAKCGPIPRREFPADVRKKMAMGSVLLTLGAILILGVAVTILVLVE